MAGPEGRQSLTLNRHACATAVEKENVTMFLKNRAKMLKFGPFSGHFDYLARIRVLARNFGSTGSSVFLLAQKIFSEISLPPATKFETVQFLALRSFFF